MMNHSCFLGIHGGRGSQPPCVLWLLRSRAHVVGMLLFLFGFGSTFRFSAAAAGARNEKADRDNNLRCLEVVEHVLWHWWQTSINQNTRFNRGEQLM